MVVRLNLLYDLPPEQQERLAEVLADRAVSGEPPRQKWQRALCGTWTGYKRHRNEGTPTCQGCKDAAAARERDYRRRKREQRESVA